MGLAPLLGLTPISDFVAARAGVVTRAGVIPRAGVVTCTGVIARAGGKEGFIADMNCEVLLGRKDSFEILQITAVGASCHRVQPAVGAALALCHAWLFTDPSGKGVLAPFASLPPSAQAPTALRSTFLLINSFQMRLKSLSWVWWFLGQSSSSL